VLTSTDGITWTAYSSSTTSDLYAIANDGNGRFGAIGQGGAFVTAPDGVNWVTEQNPSSTDLYGLVNANGNYLAVGDSGAIEACVAWLPRNSGTTQNLSAVTYGGGNFIAVGVGNAILQSINGKDWTNVTTGMSLSLSSVAYGANKYVAVGTSGILTSSNGLDWNLNTQFNPVSVAYGNGVFAAVGGYLVITGPFIGDSYWVPQAYRSTDGINWTGPYAVSNVNTGISIIFGNSVFAGLGANCLAATSPDGITWTARDSGASSSGLTAIAYGNGEFVAVGGCARGGATLIATSSDGTNWNATSSGYSSDNALTYGDEGFVALGSVFAHSNSIATSSDGTNWVSRGIGGDIFNPGLLGAATFGQGSYVTVGAEGTILQSTATNAQAMPLISCSMSNRAFILTTITQPGYTYRIQCSTNLLRWSDEFVFTGAQIVSSFYDTSVISNSFRFYRIKTP